MNSAHIRCLDEGHGPVAPYPDEHEGTTALMINPAASSSVLLDAAKARVARIIDITKPFLELEVESFDFPREDAIRLLITLCAMAQEVHSLLAVSQDAEVSQARSFLQTVEAAESLVSAVNIYELSDLPDDKEDAIAHAILEMEGNIDAARDDFLGAKEVGHD